MPKALILCAGHQRRFEGWAAPKQLMDISGEAVLDRTLRQLESNGVTDISVVAHDERLKRPDVGFFKPERHRWLAESLLSTRNLWQVRTLILLGDVVFTDAAIAALVESTTSPLFMGRPGANQYTMCPWSELFGAAFNKTDADHMGVVAKEGVAHGLEGGPGKLSCIYAAHLGVDPETMQHGDRPSDPDHFLAIDDWTDDMDFSIEHANLNALHAALGPNVTAPEQLIADQPGLDRYLKRAEWLQHKGLVRWAKVGFSFVLKHHPDNEQAKAGLAAVATPPDPLLTEDDTFWDQWASIQGEPHPATRPATLALDRIGRTRLKALLAALHHLADEGADWAGATGRTLYRVLTDQPVTDTELLGLAYVLTHAVNHDGDLRNLVLVYPD
ncbi:NTP transferase domain-containing protein [Pseudodesulfovibrio sp.]|nr:NTP transferase domain-containing protein [Pseudodesulfovibrio sp.]